MAKTLLKRNLGEVAKKTADQVEQFNLSIKSTPTHFHKFIIAGVINIKAGQKGWRIVGIWGDEDKYEGNRIGPYFKHEDYDQCEKLLNEIEAKYSAPYEIHKIIEHFTGIGIGKRVDTPDGIGIITDYKHGKFPFLVELENGGSAWVDIDTINLLSDAQTNIHTGENR